MVGKQELPTLVWPDAFVWNYMKRWLALVMALASVASVAAATVEIKIPGEGWSIFFDAPPLSGRQEARQSGNYAFRASSDRFNLSLFVEKPGGPGSTNRGVYQYYWAQASRDPLIAKDTVKAIETDRYVRVEYRVDTTIGNRRVRQKSVNYYFVCRGKWVDVHISVFNPTTADDELFTAFDRSLRYGT